MVKKNTITGEHTISLTVVDGHPISVDLGGRVRTARAKRRLFILRTLCRVPEHLRAGGLIESRLYPRITDGLQKTGRPDSDRFGRIFRDLKTDLHVALRSKIIYFIGLDRFNDTVQRAGIVEIAENELEADIFFMRVLV